jgi:hypothetical protein
LIENDNNNSDKVSDEDIAKAKEVLEKAKKQNKDIEKEFEGFSMK